ncbi:MAG: aspartate carbamoyltransferase catalytic subunit [Acidimicrobiia bacterium]
MSLFDIASLTPPRILEILDRAETMAEASPQGFNGKTIVPMFFEPSTRTRMSFDLAASRLGADLIVFDHETSSATKGETLRDTARTVGAMGPDLLIVRHENAGAPEAVARWSGVPVVNAGDGRHAHPTQTLADLYTIRRHFGGFDGLKVGMVGDIVNSRVARGLLSALPALGAGVIAVGPATFLPRHGDWDVDCAGDLDAVLGELDIVYLLRVQKERGGGLGFPSDAEYHRRFGLNDNRADMMKPECVVMHPGPMNRGVEVSDSLADGERSLILQQVSAGVPVRMSVMAGILGGGT